LTTLSALINYIMDENVAKIIQKLIQNKGEIGENISFFF
jgi:hypothetical protein